VPQLRPRRPPTVEPPLPAPPPRSASTARALDEQLLRQRLASVSSVAGKSDRGGEVGAAKHQYDFSGEPNTVQADMMKVASAAPPPPPPEPMQAPAPRRQRSMSRDSYEAVPSAAPAAAPAKRYDYDSDDEEAPVMKSSHRKSGSASTTPTTSLPLALYESGPTRRGPAFSDPYLPAVSAGGLDYVYQAPTPATIPSSGKQVRIPLAAQTFQATAFHEATPALAATAFLRARVRNDGKRPLLRGPATIFGDGELVGVGEIKTTGPGGDIEFPLGADQDVRLVRQVVPTTKTTGVIMKSDETTYDVQIQVANYKKHKVTVEIADQLPRSRRDKVEVKLLTTRPAPQGAPDADGVVRWRVELAPGATQTLRLVYQIVRPKDWQLHQQ